MIPWRICRCRFGSYEHVVTLCDNGWEPFAIEDDWVYFRKQQERYLSRDELTVE